MSWLMNGLFIKLHSVWIDYKQLKQQNLHFQDRIDCTIILLYSL